jgi:hypothetical protein
LKSELLRKEDDAGVHPLLRLPDHADIIQGAHGGYGARALFTGSCGGTDCHDLQRTEVAPLVVFIARVSFAAGPMQRREVRGDAHVEAQVVSLVDLRRQASGGAKRRERSE